MVYGDKSGSLTDKDIQEYAALCVVLKGLTEKYVERKSELLHLIAVAQDLRRTALQDIVKANSLTRHLTAYQRRAAGLTYSVSQLKVSAKRFNLTPALPKDDGESALNFIGETALEGYVSRRELRQKGLAMIKLIDNAKKNLLYLDVLELRSRELIFSIEKAMDAFYYSAGITHRVIYPLGVLSMFKRRIRQLFGNTYFTVRDIHSIAALGMITGSVIKVANSSLV